MRQPFCNERRLVNKALAPGDWLRLNRGCVQAFRAPRPTSFNRCTNWFRTLKPNCLFSAFIDSVPASKAGGLGQPLSHCSDSVLLGDMAASLSRGSFILFSGPWKVRQWACTYKHRLSFLKRHNSIPSEFSTNCVCCGRRTFMLSSWKEKGWFPRWWQPWGLLSLF